MNTITILLCVLAKQVISQANDIYPAKILSQQKSISEDSDLYVTCSTFGLKKPSVVNIYLCKDGIGIDKHLQKQDQNDTSFTISRVGLNHSGLYSCCFSKSDYKPSEVNATGKNILHIQVIANFLPADIHVAGPSAVIEGDNVEFRCAVSGNLKTLSSCQLIQSHLKKDGTILQVQAFDVTKMETTFTIKDAVTRDSGHYSCVVLPSECIQEHQKTLDGNKVLLEVKVNLSLRMTVLFGVITLILLLGVCLWWITNNQGQSTSRSPYAESQQANTDFSEDVQEQTARERPEAQDEDLRTKAYEMYKNIAMDSSFSDASEPEDTGLYSTVYESDYEYDDLDIADASGQV